MSKRLSRAERHEQVTRLKQAGLTFKEIANYLGLAKSTVTSAYYDPTGEKDWQRRHNHHGNCLDCGAETHNGGGRVPPKRCRRCQLERQTTMEFREINAATRPRRRKYSDEQIAETLRSVATDGVLSLPEYEAAYAAAPRGSMASVPLLVMRYGSWTEALAHAGLETRSGRRGPYKGRLTRDGAVCAVCDCADEIGKVPTYAEYQEWARGTGSPSAMIVRLRCGSWWAAVEACRDQMPELAA